ncbi:MAG: tripartite tricarboxylate transporter permease [Candidatus Micrarchaeota archaeon]
MLLLLAGILLGMLAGLIPGLHSNTLAAALSGIGISGEDAAVLIIAMFGAHAVFSFVPSIFLGIPDEAVAVSVLPGQRMTKEGKGIDALKIMCASGLIAVLAAVLLFPLAQALYPIVYGSISPYISQILVVLSVILAWRSKNPLMFAAIFLLSGLLGRASLNFGMEDPFLPLFGGMFAISSMLLWGKGKLPEQKEGKLELDFIRFALAGVLLGWVADLLPGISSPAQVASFASIIVPFATPAYLALVSSIGMSEAVFAFSTSSTLGKARVGALAQAAEQADVQANLLQLISAFVVAVAVSAVIIYLARRWIGKIAELDFSILNKMLIAYVIILTFLIDGIPGLAVLAPSIAVGIGCMKLDVERTSVMGAIIVPTIILLVS